jgi:hypothetical protein
MAKHRTARRPFWTLLGAGTIACGLTVASLVPLPTVHDTAQVQTLPKGGVEVGDGSTTIGCETDGQCAAWAQAHGVWEGSYGVICWAEKVESVDTAEVLCGAQDKRPADAVAIGTELTLNGKPWVVTVTGLEPIGAN